MTQNATFAHLMLSLLLTGILFSLCNALLQIYWLLALLKVSQERNLRNAYVTRVVSHVLCPYNVNTL